MPVIIIPKNKSLPQFPTKKSAENYLIAMGKDPKNYDIKYIYDEMTRSNYPPSYQKLHRKAAMEYYLRNKERINAQKREDYKRGKKNESV